MDPQAVIEVFRRNVTQHYFDMKGRVRRQEFWYFVLAAVVVLVAVGIVAGILHLYILSTIAGLALLLPMIGLTARRLQDTGMNGQLAWILVIPSILRLVVVTLLFMSGPFFGMFLALEGLISLAALVATIAMIYFCVQPGTVGSNQYGPDPKGAAAPAA